MGLTHRSESSTTPSTSDIVPNDIPNSQQHVLYHVPFISDTHLNKFAFDTREYANAAADIQGFLKGKRVSVTYYRLLNREGPNNRTNIADLPSARNIIDTEYQKILKLEITLPKELEFNVNNAQASVSMSGTAYFYPNMNPSIGDIFLLSVGDGRYGVCRISTVSPLSIRSDRCFAADFVIHELSEQSTHGPIEAMVKLVNVFSKENYLGGTAALLTEETYLQLLKIKQMRSNLCKYYHQTFFDNDSGSFMHPDGLYDPWVVQFMTNKITTTDVKIRAKNLLGNILGIYKNTLWSRIEDRYNNSLYGVSPFAELRRYEGSRMGSFITELHRKKILYPEKEGTDSTYYVFSKAFYTGQIEQMTGIEKLIYNAIILRNAGELGVLITDHLNLIFSLSPVDQFYKIPLYIHLIDMMLQSQQRQNDSPSTSYASSGGI